MIMPNTLSFGILISEKLQEIRLDSSRRGLPDTLSFGIFINEELQETGQL